MEDLKLDDDLVTDNVPLVSGVGPLPKLLLERGLGIRQAGSIKAHPFSGCSGADEVAEERLITRPEFSVTPCQLASHGQSAPLLGHVPGPLDQAQSSSSTRSTFLMVFSPDKRLIASTHGDHNIYISKVSNGDCVKVLQGHPRTPWCVAFHPSQAGVLASGCLGGHVRIWDLHGGSEVWCADGVIASLTFHPADRLLVVATSNELHFWDWSRAEPFTKVKTKNEKEKVRYVQFDTLGHQLITGVANMTQYQQQGSEPQRCSNRQATLPSQSDSTEERNLWPHVANRMFHLFHHNQLSSTAPSSFRVRHRQGGDYSHVPLSTRLMMERVVNPIATSSAIVMGNTAANSHSVSSLPTAALPSTTLQPSASQTLSDLAQAATNHLMAENEASTSSSASIVANFGSSRESSVEREDVLLSDRPYGGVSGDNGQSHRWNEEHPERSRERGTQFPPRPPSQAAEEPQTNSMHSSLAQDSNESDHSYYRREMRERMMEIRRNRALRRRNDANSVLYDIFGSAAVSENNREAAAVPPSSFSHSPESEFVEVTHLHPASRRRRSHLIEDSSTRDVDRRARTLQELVERRQALVSQIEELRTARELLFPSETGSEYTHSPAASPRQDSDHNYYEMRPIDEWAINRRLRLESHSSSSARPATATAMTDSQPAHNTVLSERSSRPRIDSRRGAAATVLQSRRRGSQTEMNPAILNESDVDLLVRSVVQPEELENTRASQQRQTQTRSRQHLEQDGDERGAGVTTRGETSDRQNLDIVLLSRHIDHMQQICRASLSDLAVTRQRRQIVRLQSIKRMLENLQRQIRSLRAASLEELNRRTLGDTSLRDTLGSDSEQRRSNQNGNGGFLSRPRATAALCRLRRSTARRVNPSGTPLHRRSGHASNSCISSRNGRPDSRRTHTQLVSQLRATFRAMEMSPDLAQPKTSALTRSKVEASQVVMERTEASRGSPDGESTGSSTRNELRALSQRLERMLRERREAEEQEHRQQQHHGVTPPDVGNRYDEIGDPGAVMLNEMRIPGPDLNPDHRWINLLEGTQEYHGHLRQPVDQGRIPRADARERDHDRRDLYVDSSSDSEGDSDGRFRGRVSSAGRWTRYDFQSPAIPMHEFLRDPFTNGPHRQFSLGLPRPTASTRDSWRVAIRERLSRAYRNQLDRRAGLRRDEERERRRLSRDWSISRRRRRYERHFGDLDALSVPPSQLDPNDAASNSSRMPQQLREIIWRRLRRRNAQLNLLDHEMGTAESGTSQSRDRSRHREMLSLMVDQLTIDQQRQQNSPLQVHRDQQDQSTLRGAREHPRYVTNGARNSQGPSASSTSASPGRPPHPNDPLFRHRLLMLRDADIIPLYQRAGGGGNGGGPAEGNFYPHHPTSANMLLTHRIQAWDFVHGDIPDICDSSANVVVREAKIHNDASVDISQDGTLLVTLVPSNLPMTTVVGVYSLSATNRGTCYATYSLESSAVSVSLSPTTRHLLVGLTTRSGRLSFSPAGDRSLMAQIFRLKMPWEWANSTCNGERRERGRLIHRRDIPQSEQGQVGLNCIRWIPVAGQGIVYATNTGLLKILR